MHRERILLQKRPAAGEEARERASFLWVSVENRQSLCYTRRHRGCFGENYRLNRKRGEPLWKAFGLPGMR